MPKVLFGEAPVGVQGWTELKDNVTLSGVATGDDYSGHDLGNPAKREEDWDWSLFVQPAPGFEYLATNQTAGVGNDHGIIECEIQPPDGFRDYAVMHRFLDPLIGHTVTVEGTWVEDISHSNKTEIHPITSILAEDGRGSEKLIQFLVFCDTSTPSTENPIRPHVPPHANEPRVGRFHVQFPPRSELGQPPVFQVTAEDDHALGKEFLISRLGADAYLDGTLRVDGGHAFYFGSISLGRGAPLVGDGNLLQSQDGGPVWVTFGKAKFQVPDAATRARLFPNVPIQHIDTFDLDEVPTVPVDGTLLREESSSRVWLILSGQKQVAPPGAAGTVRVLWNGALAQIPTWPSILTGKVVDSQEAPIQDASVLLKSGSVILPGGGNTLQLATDSAGLYRSPPLAPGVYDVSAAQSGFAPSEASVTVVEGVPTTTENFVLQRTRPFTVTGTVTDSRGAAIAGATVTLVENSAVPGILKAQTDSSGRYSITLDPGPYAGDYTISAAKSGFTSTSVTVVIPNGATVVENFTLAAQGTVTGQVTDSSGAPLAGAAVAAGSQTATTDSAGRYRLTVDPGAHTVTASAHGFANGVATVTITPASTITQNFALSKLAVGTITGNIASDDGLAIRGATVSVAGVPSTTTDASGDYTLTNVPAGSVQVTASAALYWPGTQSVPVTSNQTIRVDLSLQRRQPRPPGRPA